MPAGTALALPAAPSNLTYIPNLTIGSDDGVHYWLGVQLVWQNNDPLAAYTIVQTSTNNGASWFSIPGTDLHSGTTTMVVKKVPQGAYYLFRVYCIEGISPPQVNSPYSNVLPIWGEQAPSSLAVAVDSTNQVRISWKDNSRTENGFMVERATTPDFSDPLTYTSAKGSTVAQGTIWATNTDFAPNATYYWRVRATNSLGYLTEASTATSATPNAAPPPPSFVQTYNVANGVAVRWNSGGGLVDRWYVDVSVGDANNFVNLMNTPGGSPGYDITDQNEAPGAVCYYRVTASNVVGTASSPVQMVIVSQPIAGSVWYVDAQATGNNNGTSWANAFPNFASIAWANIHPGAMIWVAPANYDETVYIGASGTSNAPVTIKLATTNSPRAGIVRLNCIVNQSHPYVRWDGAKSDTFNVVTTEDITGNCGILLYGNTNIARAFYTIATGTHIKWLEITGPYVNAYELGEGSVAGVYLAGGAIGDTEVGYCWIHDMTADNRSGADGIDVNPDSGGNAWGAANIHHTIIERVRDNFIAGGGGIDVHDCILRDWTGGTPSAAHPDGIQNGAGYWRIYNNIIRDTPGACLYPEIVLTNTYGVLIYNNIFYGTGRLTNFDGQVYPGSGITWSTEPNAGFQYPVMTVSTVLIANNTFYGFDPNYLSVTRRSTECANLVLRQWTIANNLVFTHSVGAQFGAGYISESGIVGSNFTSADIRMDWNDVCGANNLIGWKTGIYTTYTIGAVTGFNNNFTFQPQFANAAGFDFHLNASDAARLVGTNLSAWSSIAPGLDKNQDGSSRTTLGWPVGALGQRLDPGLVLWLPFNNWNGVNNVVDATGNGNDAIMFGSTANHPVAVAGPNPSTKGASISDNQYFGVTNWNGIETLPTGSIAVWAVYRGTSYGNSLILDAAYDGVPNSWRFGRVDGNVNTMFTLYDPVTGVRMYKVTFPDTGPDTVNWNHYAVTWDGSTIVGYWNGNAFATNTQTLPYLKIGSLNHWMAIGTMHHQGTPQWNDDQYPNCCYLNGNVADIRIYNRALTSAQIRAVYTGHAFPGPFQLRVVPPIGP